MQATGESGGRRPTPRDSEVASQSQQRRRRSRHRATPRDAVVAASAREQAGRERARRRLAANERNPALNTAGTYTYVPSHELPVDPARRSAMLERVKRYRWVTGRNLLRQPDMGQAYRDAGLIWDAPYSATDAFGGGRRVTPTPRRGVDGWIASDEQAAEEQARIAAIQERAAQSVPGGDLVRDDQGRAFVSGGNDYGAQVREHDRPGFFRQAWERVPVHARVKAGQVYDVPNRLMEDADAYRRGVETIRDTAGYLVGETSRFDLPDLDVNFKFEADAFASGDPRAVEDYKKALAEGTLNEKFLTPHQRNLVIEAARLNGWGDLEGLNDWELWKRAKGRKPGRGTRLFAGAASNAGAMAAVIPGVISGVKAVQEDGVKGGAQWAWDSFAQPYVDLAKDPVDYANDNPLFALTMILGGARAAGRGADLGVRAGSFGRRRIVTPGRRVVDLPHVRSTIDLGARSTNPTVRLRQIVRENRLQGRSVLRGREHPLSPRAQERLVRRQERAVADVDLQRSTRGQQAAQVRALRTAEVRARHQVEQHLPEAVRRYVQRAVVYGHTGATLAAEHRNLSAQSLVAARNAEKAGDAVRAAELRIQSKRHEGRAHEAEQLQKKYDAWVAGGDVRHRLPGDDTKQTYTRNELVARYVDALEAENAVGGAAMTDVTGVAARDLGEQTATRHPTRMAAARGAEKARQDAEAAILKQRIKEARSAALASLRPHAAEARGKARRGRRVVREMDRVVERDLRATKARALRMHQQAIRDFERAALRTGAQRAGDPTTTLDRVALTHTGSKVHVAGAKRLGDDHWELRPFLRLRRTGDAWQLEAGPGRDNLKVAFATPEEAMLAARNLDTLNLNIRNRTPELRERQAKERAKARGGIGPAMRDVHQLWRDRMAAAAGAEAAARRDISMEQRDRVKPKAKAEADLRKQRDEALKVLEQRALEAGRVAASQRVRKANPLGQNTIDHIAIKRGAIPRNLRRSRDGKISVPDYEWRNDGATNAAGQPRVAYEARPGLVFIRDFIENPNLPNGVEEGWRIIVGRERMPLMETRFGVTDDAFYGSLSEAVAAARRLDGIPLDVPVDKLLSSERFQDVVTRELSDANPDEAFAAPAPERKRTPLEQAQDDVYRLEREYADAVRGAERERSTRVDTEYAKEQRAAAAEQRAGGKRLVESARRGEVPADVTPRERAALAKVAAARQRLRDIAARQRDELSSNEADIAGWGDARAEVAGPIAAVIGYADGGTPGARKVAGRYAAKVRDTSPLEAERARLEETGAHLRAVAEEDAAFGAKPTEARTTSQLAADLAEQAGMTLDEVAQVRAAVKKRRNPFDENPALEKYRSPEMDAFFAAVDEWHAFRGAKGERYAAARRAAIDEVHAENPLAGRFYVPDAESDRLGNLNIASVRRSMNLTGEQAFGGHIKENTGALFRQGRATTAAMAGDANVRSIYARELVAAVENVWAGATKPKHGEIVDLTKWVPIVTGGTKNGVRNLTQTAKFIDQMADLERATGISPFGGFDGMVNDVLRVSEDGGGIERLPDGRVRVVGQDVRLVPRASYDRILEDLKLRAQSSATPQGAIGTWFRIAKWQRIIMLNSTFGTLFRNFIGGSQMAAASGAGPIDAALAAREMMRERGGVRRRETGYESPMLAPAEGLNRGLVSAMVSSPITDAPLFQWKVGGVRPFRPAGAYMDWFRRNNTFAENFWRNVTWIHNARRYARTAEDVRLVDRVAERFGKTNDAYIKMLEDVKAGRVPEGTDLLNLLDEWHGDLGKMRKADPLLGSVVAFHKWYGHMLTQVFVTLPIKHPGMGHFIQQLGAAGQRYVREFGILPEWLQDSVVAKLVLTDKEGQRQPDLVALAWATGGADVWATPSQLVRTDPSTGIPAPETAIGALLPLYNATFAAFTGDTPANALYRARYGGDPARTAEGAEPGPRDRLIFGVNTFARLNPFTNVFDPSAGQDPYGLVGFAGRRYRSSWTPSQDFAAQSYPGKDWTTLPEYAPPTTAELLGEILGNDWLGKAADIGLRYSGWTPRAIPVAGARAEFPTTRSAEFFKKDAKERNTQQRNAELRAEYDRARKEREKR